MKIIGIGHSKRVGKDTLGEMIAAHLRAGVPEWRVETVGFADTLKEVAQTLYGWAGLKDKCYYNTEEGAALREVPLPEIGLSPREIWVRLGTPAIREQVWERTWIECALRRVDPPDVLLVLDTRFKNEATRVLELNGTLIRMDRPGYLPGNDCADQALVGYNRWTAILKNDRDLAHLDYWAELIAAHTAGAYKQYSLQGLLDSARERLDSATETWRETMRMLSRR